MSKIGIPSIAFKLRLLSELCSAAFDRFGLKLACALAFFTPIRLIFAYWVMAPLVFFWCFKKGPKLLDASDKQARLPESFFLLVLSFLAISSLGRDPINSLRSCLTLLLFACVLFIFRELASKGNAYKILLWLVAGQTLAAINSFAAAIYPEYPRLLTGKVSESGQLGITIFIALGLCAVQASTKPEMRRFLLRFSPLAIFFAFLLSVIAFSFESGLDSSTILNCKIFAALLLAGIIIMIIWKTRGRSWMSSAYTLLFLALPFLSAILLNNLKRGPWAGVLIGAYVFALQYAKKWAVAILLLAIITLLSFHPTRVRLLQSPEHFFISGGRSEIWQIGTDLAVKYPLGLGLKNSKYLREYSPSIPVEMKHFHNNFLNIAAESGWIGLGIFLWWLLKVISHAFHTTEQKLLARSIGCAVISWQIAGIVEYNFGDSEVLLVALMGIAVLSSFQAQDPISLAKPVD